MKSDCFAIIPAAGTGSRFGGSTKKQFLEIDGKSLLEWVLKAFTDSKLFSRIVVCTHVPQLPSGIQTRFRADFIEGGSTRFESIRKGFEFLKPAEDDFVCIHDAARPLVSQELIKSAMDSVREKGAVVPALSLHDTIKEVDGSKVRRTLDRGRLVAVQTPQAFRAGFLKKVYAGVQGDPARFTDEAKALEESGVPVYTVPGEACNIKVTTPHDLALAAFYKSYKT